MLASSARLYGSENDSERREEAFRFLALTNQNPHYVIVDQSHRSEDFGWKNRSGVGPKALENFIENQNRVGEGGVGSGLDTKK